MCKITDAGFLQSPGIRPSVHQYTWCLKVILLVMTLWAAPKTGQGQENAESRYTPPKNSPFSSESRSPGYSNSSGSMFLLGVPGISVLKGELALLGTYVANDFGYTLRLGVPYKLNWFDLSRFWDEHLNIFDDLYEERANLKQEHDILTKPIRGIGAGLGIRYLYDSDISGSAFMEMDYSLQMYRADFDKLHLISNSDPAFRSQRHDLTLSYGRTFILGKSRKLRPFIEESLGFGIGVLSATKLFTTSTYGKYGNNGEKFFTVFPLLAIQVNVGIAVEKK